MVTKSVASVLVAAAFSTLGVNSALQAVVVPSTQLAPYAGTGGAGYLYHLDSSGANSGSAAATGDLTSVAGPYVASPVNSQFGNAISGVNPGGLTNNLPLRSLTDASGSFSVEAIVNVTEAPTNFFIANYGGESETANSVNGAFYLTYNDGDTGNGRLQFAIRNRKRDTLNGFAQDNIVNTTPGVTLTVGESYHIAATWNNQTQAYAIYVTQLTGAGANNDGTAQSLATGTVNGVPWGLDGASYQLGVGQVASGDGGFGDPGTRSSAILDEVRITPGVVAPGQFTVLQAAVPEPTSIALLGLGVAGLLGRRRAR